MGTTGNPDDDIRLMSENNYANGTGKNNTKQVDNAMAVGGKTIEDITLMIATGGGGGGELPTGLMTEADYVKGTGAGNTKKVDHAIAADTATSYTGNVSPTKLTTGTLPTGVTVPAANINGKVASATSADNVGGKSISDIEDMIAASGGTGGGTGVDVPLSSKVYSFTRDMTAASGNVSYSGVGFKPTCLIVIGTIADTQLQAAAWGISDSSKNIGSLWGANWAYGTDYEETAEPTPILLSVQSDGDNNQQIDSVASYDTDGFTLHWAKTGEPTGMIKVYVLCLK